MYGLLLYSGGPNLKLCALKIVKLPTALTHPNGTVFKFELTPSADYRVTKLEAGSTIKSVHFLTLESATELVFGLMRANSTQT